MNSVKKVAKDYVEKVKNAGITIEATYLFGSFAKGKTHKDSDIDICIVSSSFEKDYFDEETKIRMISLGSDIRIEPIAYNPTNLNNKFNSFAQEIKKYGISLTT